MIKLKTPIWLILFSIIAGLFWIYLIGKGIQHFYFEDVNYINKRQWVQMYYEKQKKKLNYDRELVNQYLEVANCHLENNELDAAKHFYEKVLGLNNYNRKGIVGYAKIFNLQCFNCNENCEYATYLNEYVKLHLSDPIFK